MKLKNSTWILLIAAIVLGTGVYIYETYTKPLQSAQQQQQKRLFSFAAEDIQTLTIERNGTTLVFQRTGDSNTPWRMTQPEKASASDASLSFLTSLLVDGKIDRTFSASHSQKSEYGLDNPQGTVKVSLKNGETHRLILGKTDYEDKYLYAQIDPVENSGQIGVSLVDKSFQYGIDRSLSEWKNP
ncbi:MAG: hypothetical protein N5P05_000873 [Chroococcopsis gigantea SAG 12.99]|jgi:hypothetical protein|nr:DUF4340 domain-containing protein [Chlorogloea purpurea SAG 13.99]MDV2999267.1 hypothetical protein [Chroococcopsis gigantea SAG 12.99]